MRLHAKLDGASTAIIVVLLRTMKDESYPEVEHQGKRRQRGDSVTQAVIPDEWMSLDVMTVIAEKEQSTTAIAVQGIPTQDRGDHGEDCKGLGTASTG
jgi:hypothetical protein